MKTTLSNTSVVVAAKDQVSSNLGEEEVAILDLKAGVYYGLDTVGARIWDLIQEPKTVAKIRDTLLEEYDVEPDRCEPDLIALLDEMSERGLVEVKDDKPSA